jgi:ATP-dependent DNA ligase
VLDGELVSSGPDGLDFAALLARIHPSRSRVARLEAERPAALVAFDLLAIDGGELRERPLAARRAALERLLRHPSPRLLLTPATRDRGVAQAWLERFHGAGIDGVMAKARGAPYAAGRRAQLKVKREWTADCVVAGFRTSGAEPLVASLLLGLWDGAALRHVGVCSSFPARDRRALFERLAPAVVPLAGHPWARGFNLGPSPTGRLSGSAGRWDPAVMAQDWAALPPERVAEVAYDQLDDRRFRHPARFVRWRPDRDPASCDLDQLRPAAPDPLLAPVPPAGPAGEPA